MAIRIKKRKTDYDTLPQQFSNDSELLMCLFIENLYLGELCIEQNHKLTEQAMKLTEYDNRFTIQRTELAILKTKTEHPDKFEQFFDKTKTSDEERRIKQLKIVLHRMAQNQPKRHKPKSTWNR